MILFPVLNTKVKQSPIAHAYIIWQEVSNKGAPFRRFTICPIPNVREDTTIALLTLVLHIHTNNKPLKISSSLIPIIPFAAAVKTLSPKDGSMLKPFQKFTVHIAKSGIKYRNSLQLPSNLHRPYFSIKPLFFINDNNTKIIAMLKNSVIRYGMPILSDKLSVILTPTT